MIPSLHGKWMGKKVEAVTDFSFWGGSKITVDGDHSLRVLQSMVFQTVGHNRATEQQQ